MLHDVLLLSCFTAKQKKKEEKKGKEYCFSRLSSLICIPADSLNYRLIHIHYLSSDKHECEVGQRVLKFNRESEYVSSFHLSSFGILALPYWVSSSLERVCAVGKLLSKVHIDHIQHFSLLPGLTNS